MILIVDSGSTKSDWVSISGDEQIQYTTVGLNPFFHDENFILAELRKNSSLYGLGPEVQEVYFYGAGCSSDKLNAIIENGLKQVFTKARIQVGHDLCACAFATYENEPAISCILGTGSNSCFYDGTIVTENIPALGYILGDEGSGSYFGKKLLTDFLYNKMPESIQNALKVEFNLDKEKIFENLYMKTNANVYLASFMPLIKNFQDEPYISEMIFEGFKHFIDIHVKCYQNFERYSVHFIGSIACVFYEELQRACEINNVKLGKVIKKPIDGLVDYHMQLRMLNMNTNERVN